VYDKAVNGGAASSSWTVSTQLRRPEAPLGLLLIWTRRICPFCNLPYGVLESHRGLGSGLELLRELSWMPSHSFASIWKAAIMDRGAIQRTKSRLAFRPVKAECKLGVKKVELTEVVAPLPVSYLHRKHGVLQHV
jgi:hypothetical protein